MQAVFVASLKLTNCVKGASGVGAALFGGPFLGVAASAALNYASAILPALVTESGAPEATEAGTMAGGEKVMVAESQRAMKSFLDERDKDEHWCVCVITCVRRRWVGADMMARVLTAFFYI